jgi:hypothetical protein
MHSTVDWAELGIQEHRDRRRETRQPRRVPIEVTGFSQDGKFFVEETRTVDVSESGCSFTLKRSVERGGILAIKVLVQEHAGAASGKPYLYQVARAVEERDGWVVGAAKLQAESLWDIAFPDSGEQKQRAS